MKIDSTKLRKLREKNKLTQAEFAESIGLSQATICDWERKDHEIKADYFLKMVEIYDEDAKNLIVNITETNNITNNNSNTTKNNDKYLIQFQKEYIELYKDYLEFMKKNYENLLNILTNSKNRV